MDLDVIAYTVLIAVAAFAVVLVVVTTPEIIARRLIFNRIKKVTEALDSVTVAMVDFHAALRKMTEAVDDFSRALEETGISRLTVEHYEKELEDDIRSN